MPTLGRWRDTWERLDGIEPPSGVHEQLVARYGESQRAYHTLDHLRECFLHLDGSGAEPERPGELEIAIWFHDAIYETRVADNEERSAAWAVSVLAEAGASAAAQRRVSDLILATKHAAAPEGRDARILLDVDLSILGAPEERFREYEAQVRQEYAWVGEAEYNAARRAILESFVRRDVIFGTSWFRHLEAEARANLAWSLRNLGS